MQVKLGHGALSRSYASGNTTIVVQVAGAESCGLARHIMNKQDDYRPSLAEGQVLWEQSRARSDQVSSLCRRWMDLVSVR